MSVSLLIDWPDGKFEDVPLGSNRQWDDEGWKPFALELGLEWVPCFSSFIPVDSENIDQILKEVEIFSEAIVLRGVGYEETLRRLNSLVAALEKLKRSEGWSASIG